MIEKIKFFYDWIFFNYRTAKKNRATRNLHKNGMKVISVLNEVTKKHDVSYSMVFGSLLGAYRDKGFIKHDDDIDVTMIDTEITLEFVKDLMNHGFSFLHCAVSNDYYGYHLAFSYLDVKFDIYSSRMLGDKIEIFGPNAWEGNWSKTHELGKFSITRFYLPCKGFTYTQFEDSKAMIFSNAEEILKMLYGDDFMTPIKGKKSKPSGDIVKNEPTEDRFAYLYHFVTFEELKQKQLI